VPGTHEGRRTTLGGRTYVAVKWRDDPAVLLKAGPSGPQVVRTIEGLEPKAILDDGSVLGRGVSTRATLDRPSGRVELSAGGSWQPYAVSPGGTRALVTRGWGSGRGCCCIVLHLDERDDQGRPREIGFVPHGAGLELRRIDAHAFLAGTTRTRHIWRQQPDGGAFQIVAHHAWNPRHGSSYRYLEGGRHYLALHVKEMRLIDSLTNQVRSMVRVPVDWPALESVAPDLDNDRIAVRVQVGVGWWTPSTSTLEIQPLEGHPHTLVWVRGQLIAALFHQGDFRLVRIERDGTTETLRPLSVRGSHILYLSPDQGVLIKRDYDGLQAFDTTTWTVLWTDPDANLGAFSPSGRLLAATTPSHGLHLRDTRTGRILRSAPFSGHPGGMAFLTEDVLVAGGLGGGVARFHTSGWGPTPHPHRLPRGQPSIRLYDTPEARAALSQAQAWASYRTLAPAKLADSQARADTRDGWWSLNLRGRWNRPPFERVEHQSVVRDIQVPTTARPITPSTPHSPLAPPIMAGLLILHALAALRQRTRDQETPDRPRWLGPAVLLAAGEAGVVAVWVWLAG